MNCEQAPDRLRAFCFMRVIFEKATASEHLDNVGLPQVWPPGMIGYPALIVRLSGTTAVFRVDAGRGEFSYAGNEPASTSRFLWRFDWPNPAPRPRTCW